MKRLLKYLGYDIKITKITPKYRFDESIKLIEATRDKLMESSKKLSDRAETLDRFIVKLKLFK